ncbi:hypothetical protein SSX86_004281 [Deinandra increscens subsp. villosa]|uniref:DUF4408 domain-containing protein n=1 Tax=Deinandra increscens subsp. villosa TaxID=3103831 RepID=A0AAP0DJU7_9ASTR
MWESMVSWCTPTLLFCVTNLIIATIFIASNKHHDHPPHGDHSNSLTPIARVSSFLDRARSMNLSSYTAAEPPHQYPAQPKMPSYTSSSRLAQSIHFPSGYVTPTSLELELPEPKGNPGSQPTRGPSLFERVKSIKFSELSEPEGNPGSQPARGPSLSPAILAKLVRAPSFLDRVKSFKISSVLRSESTSNVDTDSGHNPDHHVVRSKSENLLAKKKSLLEMKKSRSEARIAPREDEDVRPATARERRAEVDEEVDAKADDFISRFKQQLKLQRLESLVRYNDMINRRSSK